MFWGTLNLTWESVKIICLGVFSFWSKPFYDINLPHLKWCSKTKFYNQNIYIYIILVKSEKCYLLQVLKVYSKQIIDKTCLWLWLFTFKRITFSYHVIDIIDWVIITVWYAEAWFRTLLWILFSTQNIDTIDGNGSFGAIRVQHVRASSGIS